jgi:hypothetical protein
MNPIGRAKSMVGLRNSGRAHGGRFLSCEHQSHRSPSVPQTFLYRATTLAVVPDEHARAAIRTASFLNCAAQVLSEMNIARLESGNYDWTGAVEKASSVAGSRSVCSGPQTRLELGGR